MVRPKDCTGSRKTRLDMNVTDNVRVDITEKIATMAKNQFILILQSCHHEPIHSHYKADYTHL
jgi:ribosome-associated translation inhibitor RaiA